MLKLLLNENNRNHGDFLRSWLPGCDDGFFAVAFFKVSGLRVIQAELNAFLKRGGALRMVVGTDFFQTDPEALRELFSLSRRFPAFQWRMMKACAESTFHPKYYRTSGSGRIWMLTGSANMTPGGMAGNIEVSSVIEDEATSALARDAMRLEEVLWTHERCQVPTEDVIGKYAAVHAVNREHMEAAAKKVKHIVEAVPALVGQFLDSELAAYRADAKEQANLIQRASNYREARDLISEHLLTPEPVRAEVFMEVYERLVGRAGAGKLWHSGGVERGKAGVMEAREKVQAMLLELEPILDAEAEAVYAEGAKWMKEIKGMGPNIFTEFCHTLRPHRFAVLNENPVTSIGELHRDKFPSPGSFKPADYGRFCRCLQTLATACDFADFGETDHFLSFVYWRLK